MFIFLICMFTCVNIELRHTSNVYTEWLQKIYELSGVNKQTELVIQLLRLTKYQSDVHISPI